VYAVYTLFFLIAAIVAAVLAGYVSHSAPGAAAVSIARMSIRLHAFEPCSDDEWVK